MASLSPAPICDLRSLSDACDLRSRQDVKYDYVRIAKAAICGKREKLKTKYLLDAALAKYKTDTQIARELGVSHTHVSRIRSGKKPLGPYLAGKLARLIGNDEIHWSIVALRDQAKTPEEAAFWQSLLEK